MIKETITLIVKHEGNRPLEIKAAEHSITLLTQVIGQQLSAGQTKGFIPYNNFECSIIWELKVEAQ